MILARNIKDRALFEGFNKVGIAGARSLEDEGRRLKEWLARGYHGEMGWMARDVRFGLMANPDAKDDLKFYSPDDGERIPVGSNFSMT